MKIPSRIAAVVLALAAAIVVSGARGARAVGTTSHCAQHPPVMIKDGFPEPRMIFSRHGNLSTTLTLAAGTTSIGRKSTRTITYDGNLPGPVLVVCPGDHLAIKLANRLQEPTNLHLHGMHVSPLGNGDNVFIKINPGQTFAYSYHIPDDQPAGSYWYHPHYDPLVDTQTGGGAAGAILVEGRIDNYLANIPQRLIVIQGGFGFGNPIPEPGEPGPGPLVVNGVVNPTLKIRPGQVQRWRIFNATSDRFLKLSLGGQSFTVLAEDGNTLHRTLREQALLIPPGSRREVLVRGGATGRYQLSAVPFQQVQGIAEPEETLLTVLSSGRHATQALPTGPLPYDLGDLRSAHVDVNRTIVYGIMPMPSGSPAFTLNGMTFDPNRVDVTMQLGSVEQWTLENPTNQWHTFHIHQNPFQVISVNGHAVKYIDWEDNVALPPGNTVVVRIHPTDFTGKFVFHCHVQFHEDHGMMAVVQVVRHLTPAEARPSVVRDGALLIASSANLTNGPYRKPAIISTSLLLVYECHLSFRSSV